jgi:hypothetical protein
LDPIASPSPIPEVIRLENHGKKYLKMNAIQVESALRIRHGDSRQWVFLTQLLTPTGRLIDAYAIDCYYSHRYKRIAYEIKVSRSDFISELKEPGKRVSAMHHSDEFYFVAPKGMLDKGDIPEGCGLVKVYEDMRTRVRLRPLEKAETPKVSGAMFSLATRNAIAWRRASEWRDFRNKMLRVLNGYPDSFGDF